VLPGLTNTLAIAPQPEEQNAPHGNNRPSSDWENPKISQVRFILTSDDAAFITGQAIVVDGGQ